MDAYEMYGRFLSFSRHFTSDYDAFKYNFKVKTNYDKFNERNDRYLFLKLSKHDDPDGLMVSNMLVRDKVWVTDLFDTRAEEIYNDWRRRQTSITYNFRNELSKFDDFNGMLAVKDGQYPMLLRKFLSKEVSPETLLGVQELTGVFSMWDSKVQDTFYWPEVSKKLKKYRPFISLDKAKLREVVVDIFS